MDTKEVLHMNKYELTVLIHPDQEAQIDDSIKLVTGIIEKADGTVVSTDNWGKKRLAYSINGENFAVYLAMDVELPASAPKAISTTLNITDGVLRYLLVKSDEKLVALRAEQKSDSSVQED